MRTFLLFCLLSLSSFSIFAQVPTDDIKRYLFTNGSLINEASPGNSNLIATGNSRLLTPDPSGTANNAIVLNGDTFNAGVRHPNDNAIRSGNVSISFWFKSNINNSVEKVIISQITSDYGWKIVLQNGKIKLLSTSSINASTITPQLVIQSLDIVADNTWHHAVCIVDKALFEYNGVMYNGPQATLYVDGSIQGSNRSGGAATFSDIRLNNPLQAITIGQGFSESIDNIRIYNKTLNLTEIETLLEGYIPTAPISYVDMNATGSNDGTSWTNAFTNLQTAIAISNNRKLWIKSGTYKPHATDRTVPFTIAKNNILLYGGFAGTETQLSDRVVGMNETVLSGDLLGNDNTAISYANNTRNDNSYTVLNIMGEHIALDGLTITGGHANGENGSPTLSRYGGGIHKNTETRSLTLTNCKLFKNVAKEGGGGMSIGFSASGSFSSLTIKNCEFKENLSAFGGAIYSANIGNSTTTYTISNSLFSKNKAMDTNALATGYAGSSMWIRSYGNGSSVSTTITNSTFVDNLDSGTASEMSNSNKCTLALTKNTGTTHSAAISNSIFWNNKNSSGSAAYFLGAFMEEIIGFPVIKNSIDEMNFVATTPLSSSSANNSNSNPLFTNLNNGDYTLSSASPAIDSGNNDNVIGTTDLLGNQRIYGTNVDRGAYEFGSSPLSNQSFTSFSDFNLYPNPTSNLLNVNSLENIKTIEIFSIEGKMILTSQNTQIDVSHLNAGMYLVKITLNNGKVGTKKLIKQ